MLLKMSKTKELRDWSKHLKQKGEDRPKRKGKDRLLALGEFAA